MKIIGILVFVFLIAGCGQETKRSKDKLAEIADTLTFKTALLRVNGMTCEGCENTIQTMVGKMEGVKKVKASYTDSLTKVVFDTSLSNIVMISETINKLGYKVVGEITL